jgi:hypothetical protein
MRISRNVSNAYQVFGRQVVSWMGCGLSKRWEGCVGEPGAGGIEGVEVGRL